MATSLSFFLRLRTSPIASWLEAIRESERRRRELVEALPIAVYTTDADGLITMFNKAAAEFAGRVPVLGTESWCVSWKMYWPDGTPLPHDECPMAVALKERRPIYGAEGIVERPDGTLVNFIAFPTPLFDGFGNLTGAVNLVLDITERKAIDKEHLELLARERAFAAERALQVAQAELAHVVRALTVGELATSIAHEVNQPLAAIVTNAEACRRWLSGEPNLHEAEESLALIVRDGNPASEVIRRIREFLKKDRLPTTGVDINEVIQEAVALGRADLLKGLVTLRVELSHELSQVQGDRIQLQQVILNLIMNGREAMAFVVDRPRELVVTSQRSDDDGIVVAVRDSGAGIEQQKLERMFDAFFTTKSAGMGMGLSISRPIVEAHGGRIWATLNDGPGLTVQFSVPIENENPS
jgi:PAS domain S-box-containing protein